MHEIKRWTWKNQCRKFDDFFQIYINAETETKEYAVLEAFLLSCSLPELLAWNDYLESKSNLKELSNRGLTADDYQFFKNQFDQFEVLEKQVLKRQVI